VTRLNLGLRGDGARGCGSVPGQIKGGGEEAGNLRPVVGGERRTGRSAVSDGHTLYLGDWRKIVHCTKQQISYAPSA
jgi:hypothetical protein